MDEEPTRAIPAVSPDLPAKEAAPEALAAPEKKAEKKADGGDEALSLSQAEDSFFSQPADDFGFEEPAPASDNRGVVIGAVVIVVLVLVSLVAFSQYGNKGNGPAPNTGQASRTEDPAKAPRNEIQLPKDGASTTAAEETSGSTTAAANTEEEKEEPSEAESDAQTRAKAAAEELVLTRTLELALLAANAEDESSEEEGVEADADKAAEVAEEAAPKSKEDREKEAEAAKAWREKQKEKKEETAVVATGPDPALGAMDDAAKKRTVQNATKKGARLVQQGKAAEALKELSKAYELAPGSARVNLLMGQAYLLQRQYSAAVRHLERAVNAAPGNGVAIEKLGTAYMASGNRQKAFDTYKKYLQLKPDGATSDKLRKILAMNGQL